MVGLGAWNSCAIPDVFQRLDGVVGLTYADGLASARDNIGLAHRADERICTDCFNLLVIVFNDLVDVCRPLCIS